VSSAGSTGATDDAAPRHGGAVGGGGVTPVDLASLAKAPWILPPPGTSCHDMVVRACARAGFEPRGVGHCGDFGVVCALAAAGHGVGLVPGLGVTPRLDGLAAAPTAPPLARRVFAAVRPGTGRHPHIAATLQALREAA
jgi:DNA-binding transcriptional LysR family regulator